MPTRLRRALAPLFWIALALPGSSCMTQDLWEADAPVCRVALGQHAVDAEIVVTADGTVEGALRLEACREGELAPPDASGMAGATSSWRLRPVHGADTALVLLDGFADFDVESIEVRAVREVAQGVVTFREAELRIHGHPVASSLATAVEGAALPAGVVASLRQVGDADLLLDYTLPLDAPELLAECARRLRTLDLGSWLPGRDGGRARVSGCVWLDAARLEVIDGARAQELVGWFVYSDRSLARRLEALRSLRILVAVDGRGGAEFYLLRPDLVWLCSALDASGGVAMHSSMWWADPVAAQPEGESALVLGRGSMHLDFLTARYEPLVAQDTARKILLTPYTVSVDIVGGIVRALIENPVATVRLIEDVTR